MSWGHLDVWGELASHKRFATWPDVDDTRIIIAKLTF